MSIIATVRSQLLSKPPPAVTLSVWHHTFALFISPLPLPLSMPNFAHTPWLPDFSYGPPAPPWGRFLQNIFQHCSYRFWPKITQIGWQITTSKSADLLTLFCFNLVDRLISWFFLFFYPGPVFCMWTESNWWLCLVFRKTTFPRMQQLRWLLVAISLICQHLAATQLLRVRQSKCFCS